MIERLLIVIAVALVGVVIFRLLTRRQLAKAGRLTQTAAEARDPLLQAAAAGLPTLVYFTTPTCGPCRLRQTPILEMLKQEAGEQFQVIRVDATADPDAATRWGVFSVPTTFVLAADGKPRRVFNGVVSADVLRREIGLAG